MEQPISGESVADQQPIVQKPQHGARAAKIRRLHTSYPELSQAAIAKRVGCSVVNVYGVLKRFLGNHSEDELREFQENKADVYDATAHRILESITNEKLAKMQVRDAVVSVGILHDKTALILGQATSNVNVRVLLDVAGMIRRDSEQ